jgi:hypothetical protein
MQVLTCNVSHTYVQMLRHDFCTFAGLTATIAPVAFAPDVTSAVALLLMRSR